MLLQEVTQFAQQNIAGFVSMRIIEALEVIEVEHDHTDRALQPQRAVEFPLESLLQITPVEQACERITNGLLPQKVSQLQIGQCQDDTISHGNGELLFGFGQS